MTSNPKVQCLNIYVGAAGLLLASLGGLALGATFDQYAAKDGYHVLSLVRFYLREGHSHGMPIALYNLVVGLLIPIWFESPKVRKITSHLAAVGMILPLGLATKGAMGADPNFVPFGIIGAIGLIGSFLALLLGRRRSTIN